MIIHTDGIPEFERILCWVRWDGRRWRCFGRIRHIDDEYSRVDVFHHSLPRLESEHGTHVLEFEIPRSWVRKDPSGSAAWVCDEELDGDRPIANRDNLDDLL